VVPEDVLVVDRPFDRTEPEDARVEVEVRLRVADDAGHAVDAGGVLEYGWWYVAAGQRPSGTGGYTVT
jgi:hypothetical protein